MGEKIMHRVGHPDSLADHANVVARQELMASIDRFIVKHYGDRCSAVQGGCPCCAAWAARDVLNATLYED
jgi:hypothetical protein